MWLFLHRLFKNKPFITYEALQAVVRVYGDGKKEDFLELILAII